MNLEKMMETYKKKIVLLRGKKRFLETIQKSKEIVMEVQSENTMSYTEFLFFTVSVDSKKRWWMLQAMLLVLVFLIMPSLKDTTYFMRMLGVASVFL